MVSFFAEPDLEEELKHTQTEVWIVSTYALCTGWSLVWSVKIGNLRLQRRYLVVRLALYGKVKLWDVRIGR